MEPKSQFEWGKKGGVGDEGGAHSQYYESFTLNNQEYLLNDCVHLYKTGETETDIGKLVKIYETEAHGKMIRVIWFFRPTDIRNFLGDYEPCWNEIFLASGEGVGLSNVNHLEAIIGKCRVLCTSKDPKNPQPSQAELSRATYIFSRTFDVGKREILENFPDEIQGVPVECFLNKTGECFLNQRNDEKLLRLPDFQKNLGDPAGQSNVSSKLGSKTDMASPVDNAKSSSRMNPVVRELENPMVRTGVRGPTSKRILKHKLVLDGNGTWSTSISHGQCKLKRKVQFIDQPPMSASNIHPYKKMIISGGVASTKAETAAEKPDDRSDWLKNKELDRSGWFKKKELTWEQKLQSAQDAGSLVLLENLTPSYASSEVEDLVSRAFNQKVEAKMIQRSALSVQYYGKAFAVFESKFAADKALSDLEEKCLVLDNGRCVVGSRITLKVPDKAARFVGHLSICNVRRQNQREEMRKAVSTSHCAQPNTVEYDLAMAWRLQEQKSDRYWEALAKEQCEDIKKVRKAKSQW